MRLLAYPAALVLAFVLYLSCPKLAPLVLSLPKKILPLLTKLDQKLGRPPYAVSYPVYLLLFFLVGLLLSLIHPAVSAVTMALPLLGLAPAARSSASWTPALLKKTSRHTKPRFGIPAPRWFRNSSRTSAPLSF